MPWSRVRCHGCRFTHRQFHSQFHLRWQSLRITLKYTTLVHMRSGYAWTMKSWERSEWRLGFNSVLVMVVCDINWWYRTGTSIQQEPEFGTSEHYRNPHENVLKVLGHSVGLCKTTKRKGKLFIILLVDVWRIICENFNPIRLILAEIWMKI